MYAGAVLRLARVLPLYLASLACGPGSPRGADSGDDDVGDSSSSDSSNSDSSDDGDSVEEEGNLVFLDTFDEPSIAECDPFAQDCPDGDKCIALAVESDLPDENVCVPISGDQAPGEPCIGDGQGLDDCDGQSVCHGAMGSLEGTCVPFCGGTPDAPQCEGPTQCWIYFWGAMNLCLPTCDPLTALGQPGSCTEGSSCRYSGPTYFCVPDGAWPAGDSPIGAACDPSGSTCAPGTVCVGSGEPTCSPFCDVESGEPGCPPNRVCTPLTPELPEYDHVGACVVI